MEEANKEVVETPPAPVENQVRKDNNSIRESLARNAAKEPQPDDAEIIGNPSEPAKGKSFVNNEVVAPVETPKETILPPASMSAAEKQSWNSLSPEAQKFLSRREYETTSTFNRRMSELQTKEKEVNDIYSTVTPEVREEYARKGVSLPDITRRAIAWDKRLSEGGVEAALEYLGTYGITPEQISGHKSESVPEPQYLTREEAEKLAEEKYEQKRQAEQQSSIAEKQHNALQSWIDSKDIFTKGDPGTASQVEAAVAREVEYLKFINFSQDTVTLLEEGYKRAINNNEAFSSLRTQNPVQVAKPDDIHEQMKRVREAKQASRSATGSLGSGSPVQKASSIRESLQQNFAKFR